jgi:hypothetical protein
VRSYTKGCKLCQRVKPSNHAPFGTMASIQTLKRGDALSCDLIGPLPKSHKGHEHALVIVDEFSRNVEIFPLRKATTLGVCDRLVDYCCRNGFPKSIRSDNGPQFVSRLWDNVCKILKIAPRKLVPYRPQGNPTERANRTNKQCIKMYADDHSDWDKCLNVIAFAVRTSENETTGFSPARLTFGEELRSPFDTLPNELGLGENNDGNFVEQDAAKVVAEMHEKLQSTYEVAKKNCLEAHERQKQIYDKGRKNHKFKVVEWVWRRAHTLSSADKGVAKSLSKPFDGPYLICDAFGDNNFCLDNAYGASVGTCNADQLRPYNKPPGWALDSTENQVDFSVESQHEDQVTDKVIDNGNAPCVLVDLYDSLPTPEVASRPRRTIKRPSRYLD